MSSISYAEPNKPLNKILNPIAPMVANVSTAPTVWQQSQVLASASDFNRYYSTRELVHRQGMKFMPCMRFDNIKNIEPKSRVLLTI